MTMMLPAITRTCYALIYPMDCAAATFDAFAFPLLFEPDEAV
jgi:hypothetical protein